MDDIIGSDIADKTGWDESTMLRLLSRFVTESGQTDACLEFLNNLADEELDNESPG